MFSFRRSTYVGESTTLDIGAVKEEGPAIPVAPREKPPTRRILLLDDQTDFRDVIEDYLSMYLFKITPVSNGAEGLREVVKDPFDLILCDMMMPKLNGEMFYWAVTRMRPAAGHRFIFLTGHRNDPAIQSFFQRVNAVVLIKPFKLEMLHRAIQDVFAKLR